MNNLENRKILSEKMLNVIKELTNQYPNIVFGGSIGLNAVGLIEREIGDVDLFVDENHQILKSKYFKSETVIENENKYEPKSDKPFDLNNLDSSCLNTKKQEEDQESPDPDDPNTTRLSLTIDDVKVCVFKTSNPELLNSFKFKVEDIEINIQHIKHALIIKQKYVKKLSGTNKQKHLNDLSLFQLEIEDKFPF